jgi:LPXTG-motif cell wall-anchored protein
VFVDTATNTVTSNVTVGATPYGSVIAPSGLVAYVADWGGGFGNTLTQLALGWGPPPTSAPPTSEPPTTEPPSTDPPITETPSTEATVTTVNGSLPSTGANTQWFVIVAVALAGLGAALSFISRRRA